jgi:hypothetical protein
MWGEAMPSLRDLQLEIFRQITHGVTLPTEEGLYSRQRLNIYRNNVYSNLIAALRLTYPVVEKLVGVAFFRKMAHVFSQKYASIHGDLNQYGVQFPDFLATYLGVEHLVYLPDVARLEWLYQEVYFAADSGALEAGRLASFESGTWDELQFKLNPAARLLSSEYPVHHIWRVNQPQHDDNEIVDLDEGGVKLLIIRRDNEIEMQTLTDAYHRFLLACMHGKSIGAAYECALEVDLQFDLASMLMTCVESNILVDFSIAEAHRPMENT